MAGPRRRPRRHGTRNRLLPHGDPCVCRSRPRRLGSFRPRSPTRRALRWMAAARYCSVALTPRTPRRLRSRFWTAAVWPPEAPYRRPSTTLRRPVSVATCTCSAAASSRSTTTSSAMTRRPARSHKSAACRLRRPTWRSRRSAAPPTWSAVTTARTGSTRSWPGGPAHRHGSWRICRSACATPRSRPTVGA